MSTLTVEQLNALFEKDDPLLLDDSTIRRSTSAVEMMSDPERKARQKASLKAMFATPEGKAKAAKGMLGKKQSEATKLKMSAAATGKVFSEEHKKNIQKVTRKMPTPEEVVRYKDALTFGQTVGPKGTSWGEAARKFNVSYHRLKIYGSGERLEELE